MNTMTRPKAEDFCTPEELALRNHYHSVESDSALELEIEELTARLREIKKRHKSAEAARAAAWATFTATPGGHAYADALSAYSAARALNSAA